MTWILKHFNELTTGELYAILQLRCEVFIVEQTCPYLDQDNKDQQSFHLMCWDNETLAAYTRLLPPELSFKEASIGRVVTSPKARGTGIGKELMLRSIEGCYQSFGKVSIRIGAQLYLREFYRAFGFREDSEVYLEDNIEHIEMIKTIQTS